MNKKGFTLIELIAVIGLIGIIAVLVTPNLINIFNTSTNKAMKVQESEVKEAGLLYLEDYCKNPSGNRKCPYNKITLEDDYTYSGCVLLSELVNNEYIDDVILKGQTCTGYVLFDHNDAVSYLRCGDSESIYVTNGYTDGAC